MKHAKKIEWMHRWCQKQGLTLNLEGECGFGRACVGVSNEGTYPSYSWDGSMQYVWKPEGAYHKYPCVAVLGRGEEAEAKLYDWLKWFDKEGFVYKHGDNEGEFDAIHMILGHHRYHRMVKE